MSDCSDRHAPDPSPGETRDLLLDGGKTTLLSLSYTHTRIHTEGFRPRAVSDDFKVIDPQ